MEDKIDLFIMESNEEGLKKILTYSFEKNCHILVESRDCGEAIFRKLCDMTTLEIPTCPMPICIHNGAFHFIPCVGRLKDVKKDVDVIIMNTGRILDKFFNWGVYRNYSELPKLNIKAIVVQKESSKINISLKEEEAEEKLPDEITYTVDRILPLGAHDWKKLIPDLTSRIEREKFSIKMDLYVTGFWKNWDPLLQDEKIYYFHDITDTIDEFQVNDITELMEEEMSSLLRPMRKVLFAPKIDDVIIGCKNHKIICIGTTGKLAQFHIGGKITVKFIKE